MPAKFVRQFVKQQQNATQERVVTLSQELVEQIARRFKVSEMVAILRLRRLGYAVLYIALADPCRNHKRSLLPCAVSRKSRICAEQIIIS